MQREDLDEISHHGKTEMLDNAFLFVLDRNLIVVITATGDATKLSALFQPGRGLANNAPESTAFAGRHDRWRSRLDSGVPVRVWERDYIP